MTRVLTLLTALALAPAAMAAPAASVPASGQLAFDVIRNGRDIGDYVATFHGSGNDLTVDIATHVSVKLPVIGISAYRFNQTSTETWRGGRLAALNSKTDDNGTPHDIKVGATALVPASLWNADLVHASSVLNTIDGSTDQISVRNLGAENVMTGSGQVQATHYAVRGGLDRDVWYAGSKLVHVRFTADDGSQVDYVLR
ncbi:DUF6134 family protein [Falsirhodobacter halotolerans]|uniref:DUF6134 family protein n=1 Tax=Falsirhodobacter halotolerans TaxID=1146892 RepID=UPI001FD1E12F|nr:DUF6134 family protein [Falsirhodobacter halotolerans]MCJ8140064.1 DUF6134 family protein [Falsirhodobacter halotolerans]